MPLASIGIPTYNRVAFLERAVESVLAQDYSNLELVISDNASTDETETYCRKLCTRDARVRYIRQPENRGITKNFRAVLEHSRGTYFMWLGDDDWLDKSFLSQCMQYLEAHPSYSMACGKARFFKDEEVVKEIEGFDLTQDSPRARVLGFYSRLVLNVTFYGVVRREQALRVPLLHTVGSDLLFTAAFAYMGKIKMLHSTSICQSASGMSSNWEDIARHYGQTRKDAGAVWELVANWVFKHIMWECEVYRKLNPLARLVLAKRASAIVIARFANRPRPMATYVAWSNWVRGKLRVRSRALKALRFLRDSTAGVFKRG